MSKKPNTVNASNLVDYIIAYESGELGDSATIEFFQYLIDTGQAWTLQGHYGRTARALIEAGYCYPADVLDRPGTYIDAEYSDATETLLLEG
jgi:hypothetical protein